MLIEKMSEDTRNQIYEEEYRRAFGEDMPIHIPFLVLIVGQACSLKCKNCGNFSPFAPQKCLTYDCDKIIDNLHAIFQVATIDLIQIQGGEPFLYCNLLKIISAMPDGQSIRIATNGTIMPSNELIEIIKKRNIEVRISDYHISKYEQRITDVKNLFEENNIIYSLYSFTMGTGAWLDLGGIDTPKCNDINVREDRYWTCSFGRNCLTLENGILGYCSRSTIAPIVQGFGFDKEDYLFLDEQSDESIKKDLFEYIYRKHSMKCCEYCYGMRGEAIKPAIQL